MAVVASGLFLSLMGGCAIECSEELESETMNAELESSQPVVPEGATSWQADGLRALVRNNPGARIISSSEVQLSEGVVAVVPAGPNSVRGCPDGNLCLNSDASFGGDQLNLVACEDVDLRKRIMRNGTPWHDQVSSIRNAHFDSDTQARFYTFDSSGIATRAHWKFILALNPGHYLRNLSQDTSAEGGNANDKIDIVHVCDF